MKPDKSNTQPFKFQGLTYGLIGCEIKEDGENAGFENVLQAWNHH